ncbi:hypothetical protein [Tolypothrix sp. VBCCA 56010]|uniref:hypothetical protein n=1 Tax=Tolypothrix sp. VBCCA 56010 TaxID=3137731 RepID=UPI003D7D6A15
MKKQDCAVWLGGVVFIGLSPFVIVAGQRPASAACPIPDSVSDKDTIITSFLNSECTKQTLTQDTTYYRYYNDDNTYRFGRFLTTNFYDSSNGKTTLDAIRELALAQYFGPPPNLAQLRERVTLPAGLDVYVGVAGPQSPKACYPGGATQTFIENTRTTGISFIFDGNVPDGGSLPANCYTAGKSIPEPSPLFGIGAIAIFGLATIFNPAFTKSKIKQIANG